MDEACNNRFFLSGRVSTSAINIYVNVIIVNTFTMCIYCRQLASSPVSFEIQTSPSSFSFPACTKTLPFPFPLNTLVVWPENKTTITNRENDTGSGTFEAQCETKDTCFGCKSCGGGSFGSFHGIEYSVEFLLKI